MAGSWLDALLGAVFNSGSSVPLSGGLNFTGGLRAVLNRATGRVDVTLTNPAHTTASQTDWAPLDGPSDTLVVLAEGHDPGFYLVGLSAVYEGTSVSAGAPSGVVTWTSDGQAQTRTTAADEVATSDTSAAWHVPPALVYSDGTADITAQMTDDTVAGSEIVGIVRAVALRVSG